MPIQLPCARCQRILSAPDIAAGKLVRCPVCQEVTPVPAAPVDPQVEAIPVEDANPYAMPTAQAAYPNAAHPWQLMSIPRISRPIPPPTGTARWRATRAGLLIVEISLVTCFFGMVLIVVAPVVTLSSHQVTRVEAKQNAANAAGIALLGSGLLLLSGIGLIAGKCVCLGAPSGKGYLITSLAALVASGITALLMVVVLMGYGGSDTAQVPSYVVPMPYCVGLLFVTAHMLFMLFVGVVMSATKGNGIPKSVDGYLGAFLIYALIQAFVGGVAARVETWPVEIRLLIQIVAVVVYIFFLLYMLKLIESARKGIARMVRGDRNERDASSPGA